MLIKITYKSLFVVIFFACIIIFAVYQYKSPATFEASHDLQLYAEQNGCTRKDTAEGIDSLFTAMPSTLRYEYTCENGRVFRSNK